MLKSLMIRRNILVLMGVFLWLLCASQNNRKIDSLKTLAATEKNDTLKAALLNRIMITTVNEGKLEESVVIAQTIKKLVSKSIWQKGFLAFNYMRIGVLYINKSEYELADKFMDTSLIMRKKNGDMHSVVATLNWKGVIKWYTGNYDQALSYYMDALNITRELKDTVQYLQVLTNIGLIHYNLKHYDLSIKYYTEVIQKTDSTKKPKVLASTLDNLGLVYADIKKLDKALALHLRALKIVEILNDKVSIGTSYVNIGGVYYKKKNLNSALYYYEKAKKIKEEVGDDVGLIHCYNDIASVYQGQYKFDKAREQQFLGIKIAEKINARELIKELNKGLSESSYALKDYKKAYDYYKNYTEIKDSIYSSESNKQIAEMETKYQTEKKEQENKLLKQQNDIQVLESEKKDSDLKKQKIIILLVSVGLVIVLILAIFVLKGYREKQKANKIISEQKELVEEKQKEILDSIRYAKRIQQSLLPTEKFIERVLKNKP